MWKISEGVRGGTNSRAEIHAALTENPRGDCSRKVQVTWRWEEATATRERTKHLPAHSVATAASIQMTHLPSNNKHSLYRRLCIVPFVCSLNTSARLICALDHWLTRYIHLRTVMPLLLR